MEDEASTHQSSIHGRRLLQWRLALRCGSPCSCMTCLPGPTGSAEPPINLITTPFHLKRRKYLPRPFSPHFSFFLSHRRALCSQPIRDNDRRIPRMFPEHVERSFLDPEYTFGVVGRILPATFAKKSWPN